MGDEGGAHKSCTTIDKTIIDVKVNSHIQYTMIILTIEFIIFESLCILLLSE